MDAVVTTANENEPLAWAIPVPEMAEKDVLVKVAAVAVNPVDAKQRDAAVAKRDTCSLFDAVGEVVAVGENYSLRRVTNFLYRTIGSCWL